MPTTLSRQIVLPTAQNNLITYTEQYCQDKIYGTTTCPMSLAGLVAMALLILGATNNCGSTTQDQMECFLNNLNTQLC